MSTAISSPTRCARPANELPFADLLLLIGINKQQIKIASHASYTHKIHPNILDSYPKNASIIDYPYINNIDMVLSQPDLFWRRVQLNQGWRGLGQ